MKHIVVFASGSGTNFQSLIDAVESGQIKARIRGLISNKTDNKALNRAREHSIETVTLAPSSFTSYDEYEETLLHQLKNWETDLIVLAGYMIKVPVAVIEEYRGRIVNIHPSLLPKYGGKGFYGINVHRAVIENEEKQTGCTVHLVTEEYDGNVAAEKYCDWFKPFAKNFKRVLKEEHKLLPKVVAELIEELNQKSR